MTDDFLVHLNLRVQWNVVNLDVDDVEMSASVIFLWQQNLHLQILLLVLNLQFGSEN